MFKDFAGVNGQENVVFAIFRVDIEAVGMKINVVKAVGMIDIVMGHRRFRRQIVDLPDAQNVTRFRHQGRCGKTAIVGAQVADLPIDRQVGKLDIQVHGQHAILAFDPWGLMIEQVG